MTIQISFSNGEVSIKGDEHVLTKLPEGFDAATFDLQGVSISAQTLAVAFNDAEGKGEQAVKKYAALKQAFIHQQELVAIEANKPKEHHAPAITSQNIKPVNA